MHLGDGAQVLSGDPSVKVAAAGPPPKIPRRPCQLPLQLRNLRLLLLDPLLTGFGGLHLRGRQQELTKQPVLRVGPLNTSSPRVAGLNGAEVDRDQLNKSLSAGEEAGTFGDRDLKANA